MHTQGNQLVSKLLLKLSDTLHKQYRYIKHLHEEVSCQKQFFGKMTAYRTKQVCMAFVFIIVVLFIDHYCAGGVGGGGGSSNKHCLLSFVSLELM